VVATYVELIGVLVGAGQLPEAEQAIHKVLSLNPECIEAREKRIEIEKHRGHTERAVYLARELARLCIEQGDGDRSIRLLQEAQKDQPENLDISLELAEMFVSHGQIQDGANQYRKVANAFQEAGNIGKAAEAYRRMKVVQSDDPEVLLTLGRLYTELGKLDEAEQEFRSVLRHDLEHQDALLELGLVCQLKGRFRSGLLAFNKVLQNNPKLAKAMRKLGELNLSMGKQDEAVQHFLEAAQAYLEEDDKDEAIEVFQIVLGVEEGNAQAQQGLNNLGAPVEPKEFQPPLPPTPPEDEPPTPEAKPVSAGEIETLPPPPPSAEAPASKVAPGGEKRAESSEPSAKKSGLKSNSSAGASKSKGRRKGLVSGGLLRKGLVDPSAGGGKPMLGGKPTLGGGGGSMRAGLRRPGLGMKGGGAEKPMLGMGGGGGGKPTLRRRMPEPEAAPEPEVAEEEVFAAAEADLFDDTDGDASGLEADFESAAGDLFGEETAESPFGEGLGDSLFSDDEPDTPAPSSSAVSPSPDAGESGVFSTSGATQDGEGDLFDMSAADDLFGDDDSSSGASLFDDDSSGESLFGDSDGGDDLFDDEPAAPQQAEVGGDLFGGEQFDSLFEEGEGGDQISSSDTIGSFNRAAEADLFSEPESAENETPAVQDDGGFDNLFSEPGGEEPAKGEDLFSFDDEPAAEAEPESGGGLFDDDAAGGADLFGEDLFGDAESEPEPRAQESSGEADDLFSGGDLFSNPEPEREAPAASLFDEPEAQEQPADEEFGGLFDEPASPEQGGGGLFEDTPSSDLFGGDDLFGDAGDEPQGSIEEESPASANAAAPQPEAEEFDLFSEPDDQSGADLGSDFPSEEPTAPVEESSGGLFDGFDDDGPADDDGGLFGSADDSAGGLFDEPASADLFADDHGDAPVDLFSEPEVNSSAMGETSLDMEMGGGDLFSEPEEAPLEDAALPVDDGVGLFDIPDPGDEPASLFEESLEQAQPESPRAEEGGSSLFDAPDDDDDGFGFGDSMGDDGGGSLFDELPAEEPEPATPLGLDLPMPGDPPSAMDSELHQPVEAFAVAVEDAPTDLFGDEPEAIDEDALTLDRLRAEEMARTADAPTQEPADSPEFMQLLEATLPKAEEEAPPEPVEEESVPEPDGGPLSPMNDGGLFDESIESSAEGESLFDELSEAESEPEPEPEPEPVDEGPQILGKPKVSLSIEDESPASDIETADKLDASLTGADVAAKIGAYRKALEESPNNLVMRTRLADIHLKYGMLEDALVQYRQVIRRNSESISLLHRVIQAEFWNENYAEAGESLLALAKLHLKRGEHHDALDTLQSVLSLDSHHFEARKVLVSVFTSLDESKLAAHHLRQLAETALTKGEVDEAISAFQQLLEISNDPVFEERLAQIYETQGDMERALKSFQSLVVRYQEEERWEEAARVTERIVELNPDLLEDRGGLVELYKKLGMNEKAMEQQYRLARAYQERGELEPSVRLYEDVLVHQPHNQNARRLLVDAYLDSQNVSAAMEQAEALTEYYLNTKDHQTAIELYARLVEAEPENVELQERLVKFYGLAGDPENARQRWIKLADLHESKERYDKAAEAIQKALELDENQIELQNRLALLFAERLDDKVAALTQLRKLFQMAPDRLDAVRMYIEILLKEEQVSEAGQVLQQLEQAGGESAAIKNGVIESLRNKVESNPADLKARFNYGELCYHLGDLDHAIEQFQQTRRSPDFELMSYNMLGMCFAKKKGFNMLDLAIKQFKKGLETKGHGEQAYLELRYNLAMIQYQNGRIAEALSDFKECYRVDIAYRDVRSWIEKIETELASSGS
jgi:tetratricopeptide (TPR) repeat protein